MADNINYNVGSGEYSFYSRKEVPWHRLGQYIKEADNAEHALKMAHLDYEVSLGNVYADFRPDDTAVSKQEGDMIAHYSDKNIFLGYTKKKGELIPNIKHIYRTDTEEIFDTVSDRYEVFQNSESLEVIYSIIQGQDATNAKDFTIETAGALGAGEIMFVTARLPSYIITGLNVKDDIDRYVVFTTSHNKSGTITAMITNIRVVCNNTLNAALKNCTNKVSVKHTKNLRDRLGNFRNLMGISNKYSEELKGVFEALSRVNMTVSEVEDYAATVIVKDNITKELIRTAGYRNIADDNLSTQTRVKINDMISFIENGAGQNIGRGSAYWAYNGVTSYFNNGNTYKNKDAKFKDIMEGTSFKNTQKAYDLITSIL